MLMIPLKNKRNVLIILAGLLAILFIDDLGFFEGINNYCYNLAFRVRGGITPSNEIVIVAVDEKTLQTFGRWPIRRSHYAELVNTLKAARAIGFTVIMSEPSDDDASLAKAAAQSGKVVFPLYIDGRLQLKTTAPLLASFPAGHIHVELGINGEARQLFKIIRLGNREIPALAARVHTIAGGLSPERSSSEPGVSTVLPANALVQSGLLNINFYGPPGTIPAVSLAEILLGDIPPETFRDKIVLVGVTAPGIEERMITPFAQNRDRMSSVEVQANILNNLLAQDAISVSRDSLRTVAWFMLAVVLVILFVVATESIATLIMLFTMAGITAVAYVLFAQINHWVAPGAFYALVLFLYCATFLFKLAEAAGRLEQECAIIAGHLEPQAELQVGEQKVDGLLDYLSPGGINRKISTLAAANRLLMERAAQTEAVNRELEAFSYSVSHDLRAPLRSITGFIKILREEYAGRLDAAGRDYVERVSRAAVRMDAFVVSLLELSRISRGDLCRKPIDLGDMAREIAGELKMSAPERPVQFIIAERVPAKADADLMRVVLENLLGNAWKFSVGRQQAVIELGVEVCGEEQRYFVRDNGAGFDMECADKLFSPFQRLHNEDEFPGTGIGLANVRRIINRHGGRIWAEAARDVGATFYFTL